MPAERVIYSERDFTQTTYRRLQQGLEEHQLRKEELGLGGTDYTSALHDDPALARDSQRRDELLDGINHVLRNGSPLPLRTDVSFVDVGNRVKVKFEDEENMEMYRVGTPTDASMSAPDGIPWISTGSPLGKEIVGKKKGDNVRGANILDVLPESDQE